MKTESMSARWWQLFPIVACLLVNGCFGTTPPVRYYQLQPLALPNPEVRFPETIGVSIGPVTVPEILNRPQIVIRNPRSGLQISQFNRWTEPLKTEIAAILADNIAALCGSDRIIPYTRENLFQPEYRLVIHIILLEGKPPEEIRLEAVWSIRENKTGKTMRLGKSRFQEPLISESCDDLMAAHSRILAAFSRELARELSAAIAGN